MDVGFPAVSASLTGAADGGQATGVAVLRKALDAQAGSALQLLQALPPVASNPPHLGSTIDTRA